MPNVHTAAWDSTISLAAAREDGALSQDDNDFDAVLSSHPQRFTLEPSLHWLASCFRAALEDTRENLEMGCDEDEASRLDKAEWRLVETSGDWFHWALCEGEDVFATMVVRSRPLD